MANLTVAALTEAGGDKILFSLDDNAGTTRANAFRGFKHTTINTDSVADLGVYPTSGTLGNYGATLSGSTAQQIRATSTPCQGALVQADPDNVGDLYVGTSGVTANRGATTSGHRLKPGAAVGVPCRNINEVYIRGTTGDAATAIASLD